MTFSGRAPSKSLTSGTRNGHIENIKYVCKLMGQEIRPTRLMIIVFQHISLNKMLV